MSKCKKNEFVYCGITKCPNTKCLRHHTNEPWDILVYEKKFKPDKEWKCKDMVIRWGD